MSYYDSTIAQMGYTNPAAAQALASVPVQSQAPVFQAPQGPVGDTVSFTGAQQYPQQQEEKSGGLSLGKILGGALVVGLGIAGWKTHKTMGAFKELKVGLQGEKESLKAVAAKADDATTGVSKISDTHEIGLFDTFVQHLDPRSWFSKNEEAVAKVVDDKKLKAIDGSDNLLYKGEDGKTYFRPNKESDRFVEVKPKEAQKTETKTEPQNGSNTPPTGDPNASGGTKPPVAPPATLKIDGKELTPAQALEELSNITTLKSKMSEEELARYNLIEAFVDAHSAPAA